MEDEIEERSPLKLAIVAGSILILVASIIKLVTDLIAFPGSISSFAEFFHALLDSLLFVLNFEFKLWWVFLLILYLIARWYKKP